MDTLERTWVKQVATQRGVTQAEWPAFIDRLHGSKKQVQQTIRWMSDPELLQVWNAFRKSVDAHPDWTNVAELRDFTWTEVQRRARQALAAAG